MTALLQLAMAKVGGAIARRGIKEKISVIDVGILAPPSSSLERGKIGNHEIVSHSHLNFRDKSNAIIMDGIIHKMAFWFRSLDSRRKHIPPTASICLPQRGAYKVKMPCIFGMIYHVNLTMKRIRSKLGKEPYALDISSCRRDKPTQIFNN